MGKQIKVKFIGCLQPKHAYVVRDCTVGKVYSATTEGLNDMAGPVPCIHADGICFVDDAGDEVHAHIALGFELVEGDV